MFPNSLEVLRTVIKELFPVGIQTSVSCLSLCAMDDDNRFTVMGLGDIYLFKINGL